MDNELTSFSIERLQLIEGKIPLSHGWGRGRSRPGLLGRLEERLAQDFEEEKNTEDQEEDVDVRPEQLVEQSTQSRGGILQIGK